MRSRPCQFVGAVGLALILTLLEPSLWARADMVYVLLNQGGTQFIVPMDSTNLHAGNAQLMPSAPKGLAYGSGSLYASLTDNQLRRFDTNGTQLATSFDLLQSPWGCGLRQWHGVRVAGPGGHAICRSVRPDDAPVGQRDAVAHASGGPGLWREQPVRQFYG